MECTATKHKQTQRLNLFKKDKKCFGKIKWYFEYQPNRNSSRLTSETNIRKKLFKKRSKNLFFVIIH